MATIMMTSIGQVKNSVTAPADSGWGEIESRIVLDPDWRGALDGLQQFSHAQVLTYLHKVPEQEPVVASQRRPRNRPDMPLLGVFAQRARVRPNPIGLTTCEIVRVTESELTVRGLDAIDGTPVLDIKPYVPAFDRVESPSVPEWVDRLFDGYF